jgi:hypothetical protein
MDVPGFGRWPVMSVVPAGEAIPPVPDNEEHRYLVTKDGAAYRVPLDARAA